MICHQESGTYRDMHKRFLKRGGVSAHQIMAVWRDWVSLAVGVGCRQQPRMGLVVRRTDTVNGVVAVVVVVATRCDAMRCGVVELPAGWWGTLGLVGHF